MEKELIDEIATSIASGKAVGWIDGRMEFDPRALGGIMYVMNRLFVHQLMHLSALWERK